MKRILVSQSLAMGDLLLMTPMWSAIKEAHPGAGLDVLANEAFEPIVKNNPHVDRFIPFPYKDLYQAANQGQALAAPRGLELLARFTESLPTGYDLAINPCFNDMGGALSALCAPKKVLGADFSSDGQLVMRGDWPCFMHTFLDEPTHSPFHLADLHCLAAGVRPSVSQLVFSPAGRERVQAMELLGHLGADPESPLVAVQVGAGRDRRRWPAEYFGLAAAALARAGFQVLFTGISSELPFIRRAARDLGGKALIAAGRTSIGLAAALLGQCRLLISNDTGAIHLASAMGLPCVSIGLSTVQFRTTGPYLSGSMALEPDMDCAPCADASNCAHRRCRRAVKPDDVLASARALLGGGFQRPSGSQTRFYQAFTASDGMLDWRPLHPDPQAGMAAAFRRAWPNVLSPGADITAPAQTGRAPSHPALKELHQLAERGMLVLCELIREARGKADPARLGLAARELPPLTRSMVRLGVEQPLVKPAAIYFTRRLAGLDAEGVLAQAEQQLALYSQIKALAALIDEHLT